MKKLALLFLFLVSNLVFSQIKDISNQTVKCETVGGTNFTTIEKCDNNVIVKYEDLKFQKISAYKSFTFQNTDNALDYLYKKLSEGFTNFNIQPSTLELPNDVLKIEYVKNLGIISVRFYHTDSAGVIGLSQWFTKKQIDKLFGKK